jgi:hypothetical protein
MSIESSLITYLLADPTVSSLVGTCIYPVIYPEGTTAAITYRVISKVPSYTLSSAAYVKARIELTAWATTYGAAKDIEAALKACLDSLSTVWDGKQVSIVRDNGALDGYDSTARLYHTDSDFLLTYSE